MNKQNILSRYAVRLTVFLLITYTMNGILHGEQSGFEAELEDPALIASLEPQLLNEECTPESALELLLSFDANMILINDLYRFTNTITVRSLLDSPQYYFFNCLGSGLLINLFYNQITRGFYNSSGKFISSYLNFNFANELEEPLEAFFDVSLNEILQAFELLKIQERRTGFMLGGQYERDEYYIRFYTPLFYQVRNFFLTDREKERVENLPIFRTSLFGGSTDAFAREHLITDRFGFGDTRFMFAHIVKSTPDLDLYLGFESTIPTAFNFTHGIYGNNFVKNDNHPVLNIFQLICGDETLDTKVNMVAEFGLTALDKLTANLLDRSLGNNGHVGLGLYLEPHYIPTDNSLFKGRVAVEYLFPAREKRFFIRKKNSDSFLNLPPNPEKALAFLNQQLIQTLIPCVYNVIVWPGIILKATGEINYYFGKRWFATGGLDLWYATREQFGDIQASREVIQELREEIAKKPQAVSSKLFAMLTYKPKTKSDWCFSLYGDTGWATSGIGLDYTFALRCEKSL